MSAVSVAGRKAKVGGMFCLPALGIMMISHAGPRVQLLIPVPFNDSQGPCIFFYGIEECVPSDVNG